MDCVASLNNARIAQAMKLTANQSAMSNIFLPVAKLSQHEGYWWAAAQHQHPHEGKPIRDQLHWHFVIGVTKNATSLNQTDNYKTLKRKIYPLQYRTRRTKNPLALAAYNIWGPDQKTNKQRLHLGSNSPELLYFLNVTKTHVVDQKELEIDEETLTDGADVEEGLDPAILEMLGDYVQDQLSDTEAVDQMLNDIPEDNPFDDDMVEPAAKKQKTGKYAHLCTIFTEKLQFCIANRIFTQDEFDALYLNCVSKEIPLHDCVAKMVAYPRDNPIVFAKAQKTVVDNGIDSVKWFDLKADLPPDCITWLNSLSEQQFNAMIAWGLCVTNRVIKKEANCFLYGDVNAGKSYVFNEPFMRQFQPVNNNFTVDPNFFGQELTQYAYMSIFDDVSIAIKDTQSLEHFKQFLAKQSMEINAKYKTAERYKPRPILFLQNNDFFMLTGDITNSGIHIQALKARIFYHARLRKYPHISHTSLDLFWRMLVQFCIEKYQVAQFNKADFNDILKDDPLYFKRQIIAYFLPFQQRRAPSIPSQGIIEQACTAADIPTTSGTQN